MKCSASTLGLSILCGLLMSSCDEAENPLAPYEGERPLILLRVTQSSAPEIQWVGGRAAAVGVNIGSEAGLNSSLVWVTSAESDDISSPVRVGANPDDGLITSVGGTPMDSLPSGSDYTYWIATADAVDAGLETTDPFAYTDTTLTLEYFVRGRSGGDPSLGVSFTIIRDQTLIEDRYTVSWTPADQPVRRIAIRNGPIGAFTDLVWHVVQPEDTPDGILPPVVIGEPPPGTLEVQEWLGFEPANHVLWANTSDWDGDSFGFRTTGYLFYQIFANNFE